jgi:omega-6 fatty acid desaturase (delta-12 desaturase)
VPTLTVAEYQALSWPARFWYRFFRNPFVMFGIGPVYAMVVMPRLAPRTSRPEVKRSVWRTNLAIVLAVGGLCWLIGWKAFLLVEAPLVPLAGGAGIWLFLVQHQFEGTYWERSSDWNYADTALRGSSYLRLPRFLDFFTGSIGHHHVHHLNARIPSYHLRRAHAETPVFAGVPKVSLWQGLRSVRLKLWDEHLARPVSWADVRKLRMQRVRA